MPVTINVNNLTLCHKGSEGFIKNTLPDVCKTPSKCKPKEYDIVSYSKDLVKGTTTVEADGGNMCAILGSEFSCCTGDEAGACGGVISGTFLKESTWITYSPDVFMEGNPVCRLTDKMWMNHGNTVGMDGEKQAWLKGDDRQMDELCEMACKCKGAGDRQGCVAKAIKEKYYDGSYPKDFGNGICQEVSMIKDGASWAIKMNKAGTAPTSNPITPGGGIRPDAVCRDGGQNSKVVEMKFKGDKLSQNQMDNYPDAAKDLDADYEVLDVEKDCDCGDGGGGNKAPATVPATAPESESSVNWGQLGLGVAAGLGAVALLFVPFDGPAGEAALGTVAVSAFANAF